MFSIHPPHTLLKNAGFVACCLTIAVLAAFATRFIKQGVSPSFTSFNYDEVRNDPNVTWGGPREGEKINLTQLRNENADPMPLSPENPLKLLLLADPKCRMCRSSKDLFDRVRADANANGIEFFAVSFAGNSPKDEFFNYARGLCDPGNAFFSDEQKSLNGLALRQMVVPSFLLIDNRGIVVRRFPGGSKDAAIKDQMAAQILRESLEAKAHLP